MENRISGFKTAAVVFTALIALLAPRLGSGAEKQPQEKNQQQKEAQAEKQAQKERAAVPTNDPEYLIGIEDILEISVWRNAELSKTVIVRPDGMVSLPLIGDLRAAGLTPSQLRSSIIDRLKEYQETVVASVIVQEVKSYRLFILGEVINPGTYLMMRKTTVLQAIALAGGFSQFASKNKIIVVREKPDRNAKPEKLHIRFDDIISSDEASDMNLTLRPGDTIFVP